MAVPVTFRVTEVLAAAIPVGVVAFIYWTDERRPRLLSADDSDTLARMLIGGWTCAAIGALICIANFYLSFLRYPFHRLLNGNSEYRHISGYPFVGTGLVVIGSMIVPPSLWKSIFTAILLVVDTGGPFWYLISMLIYEPIWNVKAEE